MWIMEKLMINTYIRWLKHNFAIASHWLRLAGVAISVLLAFFLINILINRTFNISFFENKNFEVVVQFFKMIFINYRRYIGQQFMCALMDSQVYMDNWWRVYMKQQACKCPFRDWKGRYKYYLCLLMVVSCTPTDLWHYNFFEGVGYLL